MKKKTDNRNNKNCNRFGFKHSGIAADLMADADLRIGLGSCRQ